MKEPSFPYIYQLRIMLMPQFTMLRITLQRFV